MSLLANEFDVRSVLQGQVSLAAVNHEAINGCKNQKIYLKLASKMQILGYANIGIYPIKNLLCICWN